MARNKMAGKGKSNNHKGTGRDYSKEKAYQSSPSRVKYRTELNQANRDAGTYGNGDGKDMSHTKSGKLVKEAQSKNRSRNGKGKDKSTLK
jgi:uncharacterized protein YgiB involved in biofilm formation